MSETLTSLVSSNLPVISYTFTLIFESSDVVTSMLKFSANGFGKATALKATFVAATRDAPGVTIVQVFP